MKDVEETLRAATIGAGDCGGHDHGHERQLRYWWSSVAELRYTGAAGGNRGLSRSFI